MIGVGKGVDVAVGGNQMIVGVKLAMGEEVSVGGSAVGADSDLVEHAAIKIVNKQNRKLYFISKKVFTDFNCPTVMIYGDKIQRCCKIVMFILAHR